MVDISGLERLLGDPRQIGEAMYRSAVDRGLRVQIAIAATRIAAEVLAVTRSGVTGVTVIARGDQSRALAPIPIDVLDKIPQKPTEHAWRAQLPPETEQLPSATERPLRPRLPSATERPLRPRLPSASSTHVFQRWGLKTLGDFAALPADEVAARLGQQGLVWQRIARGEDFAPLVPTLAAERFAASMDLEWPIEGLEPLSFVLTRLLEPLSTRLERQDRGAAVLHVTLSLLAVPDVQRHEGAGRAGQAQPTPPVYMRSLQLPAPIRDVRTLRTLILLDLESHPPAAPIERVAIVIDPTPGRVLQHTLFTRARPTPEQLSTLVARLNALMGEDRVGRAARVDSYQPGAFHMEPFAVDHDRGRDEPAASTPPRMASALRRCRRPVPARVTLAGGRPAAVTTDRRGFAGGQVTASAGPWRTSGYWWAGRAGEPTQPPPPPSRSGWDRDEWDVSLNDGAVYRIYQDRQTEGWFIDAIAD